MNSSLTKLEPEKCMELYSQNFVSKSRNVLLITSDKSEVNTMFTYGRWNGDASVSYSWICGDGYPSNPYMGDGGPVCSVATAKTKAGNWTVLKHPINYCMVEMVEENCRLRFSLGIMIVVILSNAAKAGVMIWTIWKLKGPPLVCIPLTDLVCSGSWLIYESRLPSAMQQHLSSLIPIPQLKACVSRLWTTSVKGNGNQ